MVKSKQPQEDNNEQEDPLAPAAAGEPGPSGGSDSEPLQDSEAEPPGRPPATEEVEGPSPADQIWSGIFGLIVIAVGAAAMLGLPILIGYEAYVSFIKEGVEDSARATSRGNIGTYLISFAAVIIAPNWIGKNWKKKLFQQISRKRNSLRRR